MENNTIPSGGRKRLHLGGPEGVEPHGYVIFPTYSGVSSDPTVATVGDGGDFRLAVIAVGASEVDRTTTITITRASDGATFTFDVVVLALVPPEQEPPFIVHLGELF